MKKAFSFPVLFVLYVSLVLSSAATAQTNRFSILYTTPSQGDRDFIVTQDSATLESGLFQIASDSTYAYRPMELTAGGNRVSGVIDHLLVENWTITIGLLRNWDVSFGLPIIWYNRFNAPTTPQPGFENVAGIGDAWMRARVRFFDKERSLFGLALSAFGTLPTGDEASFTSNNKETGGFFVIIDKNLGKRWSVGTNAGLMFREHVIYQDYEATSLVNASLGVRFQANYHLAFKSDVFLQTPIDHLLDSTVNSPLEALAQVEYKIPQTNFAINVGGGHSLVRGVGVPTWRGLAGIAYTGSINK